jgi:hypothetical protein
MQTPDHNTINRFRSCYFEEILEDIFGSLLDFLQEHGYIKFETYYVDGTKLEANANRFSYVWKKNTLRHKEQLKQRVKEILKEIERINDEEEKAYGGNSLEELGRGNNIDSEKIKEAVRDLNEKIAGKEKGKIKRKVESGVRKLAKEAEKLAMYEKQEDILGNRNSYSKTDPDATFIQMKEGELKPGYNPQISTENQFIVNYSVSQNAADTAGFKEHIEKIDKRGEKYIPENYVGDAGYGSEENYGQLEALGIESYLKYNTFQQDIKGNSGDPFHRDNLVYDKDEDYFVCPAGRKLVYKRDDVQVTDTGYKSKVKVYQSVSCDGCPYRENCRKPTGNRTIYLRPQLEKYKKQTRDNLISNKGVSFRKSRGPEVESFFGDLKMNQGYRRFRLRGKSKVQLELGYLCIAYNLRKVCRYSSNHGRKCA